jgi:pyruvate,water dikinase
MRRRGRAAEEALRTDAAGRLIGRWNASWRDEFRLEAGTLGRRDLAALEDDELLAHLDAVEEFMERGQQTHMLLWGAYVLPLYELEQVGNELLGWSAAETLALVSGTSAATSSPGRALDELSEAIAASAAAREVVSTSGENVLERLRGSAPAAATAFESYLELHGRRTLSYDPGDATLAERPALLTGLIRDRLAAGTTVRDAGAAREEVLARARATLAEATEEERARFERALTAAERAYPSREENVIWTDNVPSGLLRYTAIEIGRRLAQRGTIAEAQDAVFLEEQELRAALLDRRRDLRDLVAQRRAERAWVIAHPGPPSYGKAPSPPDLRGLPPALRHIAGAILCFLELSQPVAEAQDDGAITGVPGSPGLHTGPARVIHEESEFSRLRPGDVLVCPITSPAWSLLFAQAGAVVTDGGGVLAHAAVIAREYAIPAVLATGDATRRLRDGEIVTVDGTAGLVRINADSASG